MADRRRRRNHYGTSHQARNVETTRDSSPRPEEETFARAWTLLDKTGDMHRRGDSYVEKKISRQREYRRAAHLGRTPPSAPLSSEGALVRG